MVNIETLYERYLAFPSICTDTRLITKNCLFFALRGDKFDANAFAAEAIALGAAFAIVDNAQYVSDDKFILVDDVLTTLQQLAVLHRKNLQIPVIGLTGSNGKTTTKELIKAVLSQRYRTFATRGNLNNHIGVPLSILSIDPSVEIAVIEMGANHQREIEMLCEIARPTHGLITNVGMAHLEGFGGFEGVKKGKAELYRYLKGVKGIAFLSKSNPDILEMAEQAGIKDPVFYGSGDSFIEGALTATDPVIVVDWSIDKHSYQAKTNLTGDYNFENILAAICIGSFFNVSPEAINKGLAEYVPANNRSQLAQTNRNKVICDFYNANPSSMIAALKNLNVLSGEFKVTILGDMFELGPESAAQHKNVLEQASVFQFSESVYIGTQFYSFRDAYNGCFFATKEEAIAFLKERNLFGALILLKGSRGMALEQLLPLL